MSVHVRFGTADDTDVVAEFILEAGAGIFEHLFEGLLPGLGALDVLHMAVADEASPFAFTNSVLAVEDGETLGGIVCYPAEEFGVPHAAQTLISKRRLAPLAGLLESRIDRSFYVNTVAVRPQARGRGVAGLLLGTASGLGAELGFECLSLHAWTDNEAAMRVYRQFGFETTETIEVPETATLRHRGPMALMRSPIAATASTPSLRLVDPAG